MKSIQSAYDRLQTGYKQVVAQPMLEDTMEPKYVLAGSWILVMKTKIWSNNI